MHGPPNDPASTSAPPPIAAATHAASAAVCYALIVMTRIIPPQPLILFPAIRRRWARPAPRFADRPTRRAPDLLHRLAVLTIALILLSAITGCDGLIRSVMIDAPNQERELDDPKRSPKPMLKMLGADRELFVEVGPPAATLRLRIFEPEPPDDNEADPTRSDDQRHPPAPRGTILLLHGYRDWSPVYLFKAEDFAEAGYRAVAVDLRGHHGSTGRYITYGAVESRDLMQVVDALEERGLLAGRLGVWGVSMGAATAIQHAGRDDRVAAVVAVSPYTTMREVVPPLVRRALPIRGWFMSDREIQAIVDEAGEEAGFDPDQADALAAIQQTDAPVLIFSGAWDLITPYQHSRQLHEAAPDRSQLIKLNLAGHLTAGADFTGRIAARSVEWFDRHLPTRSAAADPEP